MPCMTALRSRCASGWYKLSMITRVELGLGASDDELDVLSRHPGEIPHRTRQSAGDCRQRKRTHSDGGLLQLVQHSLAVAQQVGSRLQDSPVSPPSACPSWPRNCTARANDVE